MERKKPVHKVHMAMGKGTSSNNSFRSTTFSPQKIFRMHIRDLLSSTIKEKMESEMDEYLGYEKSERSDNGDYLMVINPSASIAAGHSGSAGSQEVLKRKISDIDRKIISTYAKGMTIRQIADTLEDIYDFEASEGFNSDVTGNRGW